MLFALIKKDFLIVKKYVLLMFVVTIIIPPFMLWRVPEFAGAMGFVLSVIFSIFMLVQFVSQKENQYPKAAALICATPYPRSLFVLSKYAFCICVFIATCIIFGVETLLLPGLRAFNYQMPIMMFFVIALFFGIYFPVQYKLGYEKTRFVFVLVIMASPFVFPQLLKMDNGLTFNLLNAVKPVILYGGIVISGIVIFAISALISIRVYDKVDIA